MQEGSRNSERPARAHRHHPHVGAIALVLRARRVHTPIAGFDVLESPDALSDLRRATLRAWDFDLSAYHPLGTARMGADPSTSVVDANHQTHDTAGLYIVDGAAVPTSLGVNPQITIMALATRAAETIAATLA